LRLDVIRRLAGRSPIERQLFPWKVLKVREIHAILWRAWTAKPGKTGELMTLMLGLGLALGTVAPTFAADEKPAAGEKKPKKVKKAKQTPTDTPVKPSK
jgi:hypothetical protein